MSTLFYHPSVTRTGSTKSISMPKTENVSNYVGFLSALSQADEQYARLATSALQGSLSEELDYSVQSKVFADTEALVSYAQQQTGFDNIVIAPNILQRMQSDAQFQNAIMRTIDGYFEQNISVVQQHMQDLGHEALAMGLVIRHDASALTWVRGNYSDEEKLDIMATSMASAAGEESAAMRQARKNVEQQETIRDFSIRQAISTIQSQQALTNAHILRNLLYA